VNSDAREECELSEKRLVLWCLDGVLIPEGPFNDEVYAEVAGRLLGGPAERQADVRGRTAPRVVRETLLLNGVPAAQVDAHVAQAGPLLAEAARVRRAGLIARDRVPGATEVLLSLRMRGDVYQSLLTGDVEQVARIKANAFEFDRYLDAIDVGGYGSDSEDFADLVDMALAKFRVTHIMEPMAVVVGSKREEVEAALASGVGVVAVATGGAEHAKELDAAGADRVLDDLTDTEAVIAAIEAIEAKGHVR
jgi:phosphoglycolate phosphatase